MVVLVRNCDLIGWFGSLLRLIFNWWFVWLILIVFRIRYVKVMFSFFILVGMLIILIWKIFFFFCMVRRLRLGVVVKMFLIMLIWSLIVFLFVWRIWKICWSVWILFGRWIKFCIMMFCGCLVCIWKVIFWVIVGWRIVSWVMLVIIFWNISGLILRIVLLYVVNGIVWCFGCWV